MSEAKRLNSRNEQVAAMLADGELLKNFYRFIAQNPHINLHDACQIIVERPNATVCFSFNEWAAMDRVSPITTATGISNSYLTRTTRMGTTGIRALYCL